VKPSPRVRLPAISRGQLLAQSGCGPFSNGELIRSVDLPVPIDVESEKFSRWAE
jgi:hypothetical protein